MPIGTLRYLSPCVRIVLGAGTAVRVRVGRMPRRATIPDAWLGLYTPWVPALILLAGSLIWIGALVRNRRASLLDSPVPAAS